MHDAMQMPSRVSGRDPRFLIGASSDWASLSSKLDPNDKAEPTKRTIGNNCARRDPKMSGVRRPGV